MDFSMDLEESGTVAVLVTHGYMDQAAGKRLLGRIEELIRQGRRRFLLDFADTPIVNSSGLGEIVEVVSLTLNDETLKIAICGLSSTCDFSFRTVGIQHYASLFPGRPEALAGLEAS